MTSVKPKRLLIISTDRLIFEEDSAVRARMIKYAKAWDELHIVVFVKKNLRFLNLESISAGKIPNETAISPNCWIYSTRSRFKILYPLDAIRLGRFIIKRRGITNIACQDSSLTAMAGLALKKEFGVPIEMQIHEDIGSPNYPYNWTNKIRKILALKYLPRADSIRVVSNRIEEYLIEKLKIEKLKISVRPVEVDVDWIKNASIIESADLRRRYPRLERIILMVSRLEKEKNIELAIRAWPRVIQKIPKAGLIIVGAGSREKYLRTKSKSGGDTSQKSIIFEPWADKRTLASYYKTADAFLSTSLFEGYGMTLVEAKAAGCAVISTNVGVAKEIGSVIVDFTPESVADAIVKALIK